MTRKLLLVQLIISCCISFTYAAFQVNLGSAVKTGSYYTFPNLTVTGNAADKAYVIRLMFTRATASGDAIILPALPGGWVKNIKSTNYVQMIDISSGASATDLQTFLRKVQVTFASGKKGQGIMVLLSDSQGDANRLMYYSSDNDHWYEYVPASGITWIDSYNQALDKRFMGMTGYLATITSKVENDFIYTVTSGAIGWISGTRKDIRTVQNAATGKLSGEPTAELQYWYWSAGKEWADGNRDPSKCVFYNKPTHNGAVQGVTVRYPYDSWNTNEPNNSNGEYYTHLLATGLWNDYPNSVPASIQGYVVEYLGTLSGPSGSGTVGFESSKSASPAGGTSASPTQIVFGDEITYTITASNASDVNTSVKIVDKVPVGLEIVTGSISNGGGFNTATREITWNTNIAVEGTGTVTFKAKKSLNAKNDMVNTAYVTSGGITQQTNSTYHKGIVANVTFAAGANGTISNGAAQEIDYNQTPHTGVITHPNSGYSFDGWSYPAYTSLKGVAQPAKSNIAEYKEIKVLGNMALTANFKINTYTIIYNLDNGTASGNPATYNVNTATFTLNKPTRTGYLFSGWTGSNGNTPQPDVDIPVGSIGDREYKANWDLIEYNITYDYNGGTVSGTPNPSSYYITSSEITLNNPTRIGYTFAGWTGSNGNTPQQTVKISNGSTGNRNYKANWTPITYSIQYILGGGTATNPSTYNITTSDITLNKPTRTGYDFIGWTGSNGTTEQITVVIPQGSTGDKIYTANWDIIHYHIAYDYNEGTASGTPNLVTYDVATSTFTLNNPTRTGYTFTGWTGSNGNTPQTTVTISAGSTGDRNYKANWSPITYSITYNLASGNPPATPNPVSYNIEHTPFHIMNEPSRSGYTFIGWTGSNGTTPQINVEVTEGTAGDLVYTANWSKDQYTISYDYDGGDAPTNPNKASYNITDTPFNITNHPTREGYNFTGWTGSNGSTPQLIINILTGTTGHKNYKANWTPVIYDISYSLQGGAATNPLTYNIETSTFALNQPTRSGYFFLGWTGSNGNTPQPVVEIQEGSTGDKTYIANWELITYQISYDYKEGTAPTGHNPVEYVVTDTPFDIANQPTREGYIFAGWTGSNGSIPQLIVNISSGMTGDLNYEANWTTDNYAITYDYNGGTAPGISNPANFTIEDTPFSFSNQPTRKGYKFIGWTGSNGNTEQITVDIAEGTVGNLSYKANWELVTYHITYDYAEGIGPDIPNPVAYDIEQTPFVISNQPTRAGYTFAGWTGSNGTTPQLSVDIAVGETGDLSYTANWSTVSYEIRYNYNGGSAPGTPNPSNYDVTQTPFDIVNQPSKVGHKFVGWIGDNGNIPELIVNVADTVMSDLTYDAKWSFQFAEDTVSQCSGPLKIESGYDGLSYEWVLPDGSSRTTPFVQAMHSGDYILYTNYGSMVTVDTIYALILFDENIRIDYSSTMGAKVGSMISFSAPLNEYIDDVTYEWTISGANPSKYTGEIAEVVFYSSGKNKISVDITAMEGTLRCHKTFDLELDVLQSLNGFFVDQHVEAGLNNGTSWANAYKTLQDALAHAGANDYIWVAKGSYSPDKDASFVANYDSIRIYGGFAGWESDLSERDFVSNPTILKGNGNSVIVNSHADFILWDGFIIEGGDASAGGGIHNDKSSVTIGNSIIRNNKADEGGGIYSTQGNPVLYNVEISGNSAQRGGAMYNDLANPVITNVTISGNKAISGGGIYNESSHPKIYNTIIWGNKAQKESNIQNSSSVPYYTFSLIEGSNGSQNWNEIFGTDGSHNLDGSPLFKKNGFDDEGNMVVGDYELYSASRSKDKGYTGFIYNVKILGGINLNTLENQKITSLPYDLKRNERVENDLVDMGAYEYGAKSVDPGILRSVRLPAVEGIITDPGAGEHFIISNHDFNFTVTAKPGYSLENLDVKTGIPIRDKEGIKMTTNEDGSVKVTILRVTEPLEISINGVNPVSNTVISNAKVWSYGNKLYIEVDTESDLKIYTLKGHLYKQEKIKEPETVFELEQGVYTIVLNDNVYKVIIKN